ncbi:MAG: DUF456 domain-containing protein [Candidatus Hydrogenedentes bacterium]|nr:DUF456 domain-containing protein [Candidatus Hydrogenedentota bacterium]
MQEILDTGLSVSGWTVFGLAIVVGLLLDLLGLFGNWIILAAMVIAWIATGFEHFGWIGIGGMLALAVIGEILEFLAAGYGAKKFGGGKGSMLAALAGCIGGAILGSPIFPIVGTLIGACIGAFAGAALWEYIKHEKETGDALWTGLGAALGKVAGLFIKTGAGFAMLLVAWFTY